MDIGQPKFEAADPRLGEEALGRFHGAKADARARKFPLDAFDLLMGRGWRHGNRAPRLRFLPASSMREFPE